MSSKQMFKLSFIVVVLVLSLLIIGSLFYTGLTYLVYGLFLTWAFPSLPVLTTLQYFAVGTVIAFLNIFFRKNS